MPQMTNRKLVGEMSATPNGTGTVYSAMLKACATNRERAARVNKSEGQRLQKAAKVIDKDSRHNNWRREQDMERMRQSLMKLGAFQRVLREKYPVKKLLGEKDTQYRTTSKRNDKCFKKKFENSCIDPESHSGFKKNDKDTKSLLPEQVDTDNLESVVAINQLKNIELGTTTGFSQSRLNAPIEDDRSSNSHRETRESCFENDSANPNHLYGLPKLYINYNKNNNGLDSKEVKSGPRKIETSRTTDHPNKQCVDNRLEVIKEYNDMHDGMTAQQNDGGECTTQSTLEKPNEKSFPSANNSPDVMTDMITSAGSSAHIQKFECRHKPDQDGSARKKPMLQGLSDLTNEKNISARTKKELIKDGHHKEGGTQNTQIQSKQVIILDSYSSTKHAVDIPSVDKNDNSTGSVRQQMSPSEKAVVTSEEITPETQDQQRLLRLKRRNERQEKMEAKICDRGFDMNTLRYDIDRNMRRMDISRRHKKFQKQVFAESLRNNTRLLQVSRERFNNVMTKPMNASPHEKNTDKQEDG